MTSDEPHDQGIDEISRLRDLYALDLLVGGPDEWLSRITKIAARALNVPVALVTLIDSEDQWFCAAFGTDVDHNERKLSFCTYAITEPAPVLVVPDTLLDERFKDIPLVVHAPHVRFYAGCPISTTTGARIGTLCVLDFAPRDLDDDQVQLLRDLGALVEHELRSANLALTDELTGLANRRSFLATTTGFLELGRRQSTAVSVVFADIDGLKRVNDDAGHAAGDALIRRAATAISASRRHADLVARIGGDEFAIVLFDADESATTAIIASIRAHLADENTARPDDAPLSISFGSATARAGETVDDLVARADQAMYANK